MSKQMFHAALARLILEVVSARCMSQVSAMVWQTPEARPTPMVAVSVSAGNWLSSAIPPAPSRSQKSAKAPTLSAGHRVTAQPPVMRPIARELWIANAASTGNHIPRPV